MSQNNAVEVSTKNFESKELMLGVDQVLAQVRAIDEIKKAVMIQGTHYDKPYGGSKKDTLLKPGAEKLCVTFRINVIPTVEDLSTPDEARYRITQSAYHIVTGQLLGTGIGICSSNEEKYKWRAAVSDAEYEATPQDRRRLKYKSDGTIKQVRTNVADVENTVAKMADKRGYVAVCLKVTAASDMFEQDLEEIDHNENNVNRNTSKRPAKKASSSSNKPEGETGFFNVLSVTTKDVGGGKYTRYTANVQNKDTNAKINVATINKGLGEKAQSFSGTGVIVELVYKQGQYGFDLLFIEELIADEPEEETTETPASTPAGQQKMYPDDESDLPEPMRSRR